MVSFFIYIYYELTLNLGSVVVVIEDNPFLDYPDFSDVLDKISSDGYNVPLSLYEASLF